MQVEIIGADGKVHYTRPEGHPDIDEALRTPGYSIRGVIEEEKDPKKVRLVPKMRRNRKYMLAELPKVYPAADAISGGREVGMELTWQGNGVRPMDQIPHFKLVRCNDVYASGIAFPELLLAYADLFTQVAAILSATPEPPPLDFQI